MNICIHSHLYDMGSPRLSPLISDWLQYDPWFTLSCPVIVWHTPAHCLHLPDSLSNLSYPQPADQRVLTHQQEHKVYERVLTMTYIGAILASKDSPEDDTKLAVTDLEYLKESFALLDRDRDCDQHRGARKVSVIVF
jgi:hypothetical protein